MVDSGEYEIWFLHQSQLLFRVNRFVLHIFLATNIALSGIPAVFASLRRSAGGSRADDANTGSLGVETSAARATGDGHV